jgi:serine/threonine protein kinase
MPLDLTDVAPLTTVECPVCKKPMEVLKRFGPFELQRILGKGGMGAVYKAVDLTLNRPVALKVLQSTWSSNKELTAQFEREASLTARINHPNVVRVYSTGVAYGMFYIAMELVDKGALDTKMDAVGPIPEEEILQTCMQVAEGLSAAHRAGLIHRDIKPGNILFGEQNQAKIVDFGLALMSSHSNAGGGELWGTPYYIAPEALDARKEDFRSDMYALGASMWHALVGAPPHASLSTSIPELLAAKRQPVDLRSVLPSVHPFTAAALNKTIAFDPDQRYADYESLVADLRHALAALHSGQDGSVGPVQKPGWKFPVLIAGAALVVVAGGLLIALRSRSSDVTVVEEAGSTDESRLQSALKLIAKGQLDTAIQRLDLISKTQSLSERMRVLSKASLAMAHAIAGHAPLFAKALQELDSLELKDEPEWNALAKSLAQTSGNSSSTQIPDANVEREAVRQIFIALSAISRSDLPKAKAALDKAKKIATGNADPEVAAILVLIPDLLKEVEAGLKILKLASEVASSSDPVSVQKEAESALSLIRNVGAIKPLLTTKLAQIKKDAADALAAIKAKETKKVEKSEAPPPEVAQKSEPPSPVKAPAAPASSALAKSSPAFAALQTKAIEQFQLFKFKEGLREAVAFIAASESDKRRQRSLVAQLTAVQSVFEWAIADINRVGSAPPSSVRPPLPAPIMKNGSPFQSVPAGADATELRVQVAGSALVPIKWDKLSPLFLVKWLQARVASVPVGPQRGELLWGGANLSFLMKAFPSAEAFSREAAKSNPDYLRIYAEMLEEFQNP